MITKSIRAVNPGIIYCSVTGFGQTGPYAPRAGYDAIFQAMGGLMSVTGHIDGEPGAGPMKVGPSIVDYMTGMNSSIGILAALYHRKVNGGAGQHIDVCLLDTVIASLSHYAQIYLVNGNTPPRRGTWGNGGMPAGAFRCADGELMLVVGNDAQFARTCAVLGNPDLATDPRFVKNNDRVVHTQEIMAIFAGLFLKKPMAYWLEELAKAVAIRTEAEHWQQIVATGYLAIARRFSVVPEEYKHLTIDDTLDNLGRSILGLSVSCARCHDHKYDPIPTADYYALYGIFDSTRYPFAGSENVQQQKDFVLRLPLPEAERILKPSLDQLMPLDAELKRLKEEKKALDKGTPEAEAGAAPTPGKRTLKEVKAEIEALKQRRLPIAAQMPVLESAYAVIDETPHNARIQRRGDSKNLGDEVPRGFLQILGGQHLPLEEKGSGRLELARWLTNPQNPLTARVLVNRLWQQHFGRGLVATPSDFGKRGAPPTHPELLDAMAVRFIQGGWSIKTMHKLIMMSQTYQLSSDGDLASATRDPGNDFLWKFNRRRLDAEAIRDSLLMISGQLDYSEWGPHPFPHASTWGFTQHSPFTAVYESRRRSVYLMTQRFQRHPYLSIFDGADPNTSTPRRLITTTPIQALFMMNSPFVHEQANCLAGKLIAAQPETQKRIDLAYELVLGRLALPEEVRRVEAYLQQTEEKLKATGVPQDEHLQKAWASYAWVLLSSNEFIFVE